MNDRRTRADDDTTFLPMSDAIPPGFFVFQGRVRARRHGPIFADDLTCCNGHALDYPRHIREDGCAECNHKAGAGFPACGALVYVAARYSFANHLRLYGVDVSPEEMRRFNHARLGEEDILRSLGVGFPRAKHRG